MPFRILFVEDDDRLSALVTDYLRKREYEVEAVLHGNEAVPAILERRPDLAILEANLSGKDGLQIYRDACEQFDGMIIMVPERNKQFAEVLGLEFGADDPLHQSVEPRVLLARIKAQSHPVTTRAAEAAQPERYTFGKFEICRASRTVKLPDGSQPDLTSAEFDLLWALASCAGEVVSRDELMRQLRGIEFDGLDRTIDGGISKLRRKLHDDAGTSQRIKTVRGKGYQFSKLAWD
ncbi:winged helix-turn-helix domain-containing protein [Paraburkholderia agricolaris]|uniref:Winged helix-turn-helix domain-containing protein n=1 Tax=Paraburkholderia agricolaris TaxID=2152888 RepID=A0ABW8ZST1_9BURK